MQSSFPTGGQPPYSYSQPAAPYASGAPSAPGTVSPGSQVAQPVTNGSRRHQTRLWVTLGVVGVLVVVLLVGGTGSYFLYGHFFPPTTVVWGSTGTADFSSQDQQSLTSAIKNTLPGGFGVMGHRYSVINAQRKQNWAILNLDEAVSASSPPIGDEPLFYIANQVGTKWTVWSSGSSGFCDQLQAVPEALLDVGDQHYFQGCYPAQFPSATGISGSAMTPAKQSAPSTPMMMGAASTERLRTTVGGSFHLPVLPGVAVTISQGNNDLKHDHNGSQRYAFDFVVGRQNFTIAAAQGGRVIGANDASNVQCDSLNHEIAPHSVALDECWAHANFVLIADADGTTAQLYMHLLPGSLLVHDGEQVTQGQPLAQAGTTGWSTGTHLHFQVEAVPTPQADPYTGWWWRPTLAVTFDDPAVLTQDGNGIPLEGQAFTEGGSQGSISTPSPVSRPPTGTTAEFSTSGSNTGLDIIVSGPDGNLWFTETEANKIGKITPAGDITEYPIPTPDSSPTNIVVGPDGALWFVESRGNNIGRITPAGGISEYPVPTASSLPDTIVVGPDGNLWFAEDNGNNIGRITPGGVITEYPIPTAHAMGIGLDILTAGPDGNLWFLESRGNNIGRITTSGVITEYPVPTPDSETTDIIVGPDGALWFVEFFANKIGRITLNGVITEYPIPTPSSETLPLIVGPDGNLWFSEVDKIGRITPGGVITEFSTPTPRSLTYIIVVGPDGNLWFTETDANNIGRITTSGVITEYPIPTSDTRSIQITVGPDGNLWFLERNADKIGRISP